MAVVPEPAKSRNDAVFIDSELDDFLQYAVGFGVSKTPSPKLSGNFFLLFDAAILVTAVGCSLL